VGYQAAEPASIGDALVSVRAAIDLVRTGAARRVTVALSSGESILPAARALSRAAGLTLVSSSRGGSGYELAISREPQRLRPRGSRRTERGTPRIAS
jgi:hypothetical protein